MKRPLYLEIGRLFLFGMIWLSVIPSGGRAESSPRICLPDAVLAGLKANPNVESAQQVLEQSRLNIKAARGYFFPSVIAQSGLSKYQQTGDVVSVDQVERSSFTNQIKISQPLFAGFSILTTYSKAKVQADMDRSKLDQARLDLIFNIQKDFLQLLKSREDLKTVGDEITRIESQTKAAKVFHQAGIGPYVDVLKTELELSKAQADQIKIQNRIKIFRAQLNTYLAVPIEAEIDYVGELRDYPFSVSYDENSAIQTAFSKRPDLIIGMKSVEMAKKEVKLTVAGYYPKITLDYSKANEQTDYKNYTYTEATQDYNMLSVNLSWKLFDGGTTAYSHQGGLRRVLAIEKSLENQTAEAKAAIIKALLNIEDAKKLIDLSVETKKSALENYNMAAARYKTGIGTLNDLLYAQSNLTQAESSMTDAYTQYHTARAALFYNIGVENIGLD